MPQLAVFPKAFMDPLCMTGQMSLAQWIEMASTLDVDGLEFYCGLIDLQREAGWPIARRMAEDKGLTIPMLCCSPDFTHPDPAFRQEQIQRSRCRFSIFRSSCFKIWRPRAGFEPAVQGFAILCVPTPPRGRLLMCPKPCAWRAEQAIDQDVRQTAEFPRR